MGVTSGSFNTSAYTGTQSSPRYYTFSWSLINQSIEGNYSDISWSLKGAGGSSNSYWVNVKQKYVTVSGSTKSNETIQQTYNGTVAFSGTSRIYHNSDGKQAFTASAGGAFQYYGAYNSTGSGMWELPQIPRTSKIDSFSGNNIESNFSAKYTAYYSGFTNKLRLSIPNVIVLQTIDNYSSGASFKLSTDTINYLYSYMANSKTVKIGAVIETWNGSTKIGESSELINDCSITNANPTAGTLTYKDDNAFTTNITGDNQRIIRERSNLVFTIGTATALKGATISKYEITFNNTTKSTTTAGDLNFGNINLSSNSTATLKVTDSRGNTATKEITVIVDDWKLPTGTITLNRKNNFYSETYLKVDGTYSSLNGKNSMAIQYQYKKITEKSFTELYDLEDNTQATLDLDNNYQWHIIVIVGDRIGETTYNLTLDRGMPIIFFDRLNSSVGVNCFPTEEKTLQVNGQHLPVAWSEQEIYGFDGVETGGKLNKSGFYTICDTSGGGVAWYHLFNLRHRNGYSDGTDYGMQIRKHFSTGALQMRFQNAKTWFEWESIYRAKTLYHNSSGTTGTVTLSESGANFTHLDIFYVNSDFGKQNCKRIDLNVSNNFALDGMTYDSSSQISINYTTNYVISGTSITVSSQSGFSRSYTTGAIAGEINKNYAKILRVVGYR